MLSYRLHRVQLDLRVYEATVLVLWEMGKSSPSWGLPKTHTHTCTCQIQKSLKLLTSWAPHVASCLLSSGAHAITIPEEKGLEPTAGKRFCPGNHSLSSQGSFPFKPILPTKERYVYLYFSVKLTIYPHFLPMSHLCSLLKKKINWELKHCKIKDQRRKTDVSPK